MLLLLFCFLLTRPAPGLAANVVPGIDGEDDRRLFAAEDYRIFDAVGRLNREGLGFCTGVLIGPKEVLTAAHCVWDRLHDRFISPDALHFVPAYRRGHYDSHSSGQAIRTAPELGFDGRGRPLNAFEDWAVVILKEDMTKSAGIRPIPLASRQHRLQLRQNARLVRVGYGQDRPHLPVIVDPCNALGLLENGRMLVHDCDATIGDSGSPLMIADGHGGFLVLAVQSAIYMNDTNAFGVGVILNRRLSNKLLEAVAYDDPYHPRSRETEPGE